MSSLIEELKKYRREKDLSQEKMASLLGIGYRTYQEIEKTGQVKKAADLKAIKEKTGIDTQIFAQSEKPKSKKTEQVTEAHYNNDISTLISSNNDLVKTCQILSKSHAELVGILSGRVNSSSEMEVKQNQMAILAYLKMFVHWTAKQEAGGDPEKTKEVMAEMGKVIAASAGFGKIEDMNHFFGMTDKEKMA